MTPKEMDGTKITRPRGGQMESLMVSTKITLPKGPLVGVNSPNRNILDIEQNLQKYLQK